MSTLKAVRVPPELEPLFERAEAYVRSYFAEMNADASRGVIEFHGERYIRVRAASISIEFFDLVRSVYQGCQDADEVARSLLFDVAHAIGLADSRDFQREMGVTEPLEALSTGPVHFAYTGWAFVDLSDQSHPTPDDDFLLVYDHPNSFEADAWLEAGRSSECPVCVMNAGYSSGWCEGSFGVALVAREVHCRAQGHEACRFVMAPPHRLSERIGAYAVANPDVPIAPGPLAPRFFEQLRRRDDELVQAQRMEAIGRLAGGIAHDFNNLLTVILGCAEQLESALPEGVDRRNAEAIVGAAERAGGLTRQLLALSRKQVLDLRVVDLAQVVSNLRPLLDSLVSSHVRLVVGELVAAPVEVEPSALEQVLVNLVVNAVEAMPDGGTLSVAVQSSGGTVRLRVQDTGVGMAPEVRARMFEPFFTTKAGNSGLGLATARGIVGQFGGTLEVASEAGRGTRVEVRLPVASGAAPATPERRAPSGSTGRTVLVIEDDDSIRAMLARFLPHRGYVVHLASSARQALGIAESVEHIDLVLSDVVMPGGHGPAAVEAVRRHHPSARVLFMTGYAEQQLEQLPADAEVLRKPFTLDTLHERLAALEDA
ncbi:MAG: ATP-binding protein [Myxococcota bacterium]